MSSKVTLTFRSGVVRFDASNNLFVHLTHTPEDPHPVESGGVTGKAPGSERRLRLESAAGGPMAPSGEFVSIAELPRGFTIELRGYDSAEMSDGALTVTATDVVGLPDWLNADGDNVFSREAEGVRLWAKSSVPDGVSFGDGSSTSEPKAAAKKAPAKKAAPAQKAPAKKAAAKKAPAKKAAAKKAPAKKAAAQSTPEEEPASQAPAAPAAQEPPAAKPSSAADDGVYRPDRMPAGSYTADRTESAAKKGGLGCGTLLVLAPVLTALGLGAVSLLG